MITALNTTLSSGYFWEPIKILASNKITWLAVGTLTTLVLTCYHRRSPTGNFVRSIPKVLGNIKNPLALVKALTELPKDPHGNVIIGLDDKDFRLWDNFLRYIVPNDFFGPILIPTNPAVIHALLQLPKNGSPDSPFIGNRSTDNIKKLYSIHNSFVSADLIVHAAHKGDFKEWISNEDRNIELVSSIIGEWIRRRSNAIITEKDLEQLTAQVLLGFLLEPRMAFDESLIPSIIQIKTHFINYGLNPLASAEDYQTALGQMSQLIQTLLEIPTSYPYFLKGHLTPDHIKSHILSLMSVGFDNLQSGIMSMVKRIALLEPNERERLRLEMNPENLGHIPFSTHEQSTRRIFFLDMFRLDPAVWLQARKSDGVESRIDYKTPSGEEKSFKLHPSTLVLIPNFVMNRQLVNPEVFDFRRNLEAFKYIHPFSTGPNTCPAQKISYATLGVLAAALLRKEITLKMEEAPEYNPGVALLLKNVRIQLNMA